MVRLVGLSSDGLTANGRFGSPTSRRRSQGSSPTSSDGTTSCRTRQIRPTSCQRLRSQRHRFGCRHPPPTLAPKVSRLLADAVNLLGCPHGPVCGVELQQSLNCRLLQFCTDMGLAGYPVAQYDILAGGWQGESGIVRHRISKAGGGPCNISSFSDGSSGGNALSKGSGIGVVCAGSAPCGARIAIAHEGGVPEQCCMSICMGQF